MPIFHPTRSISSIRQIYILLHSPKTISKNLPKILHTLFVSYSAPPPSPFSTMAGELDPITVDVNVEYGFERSEMYKSNIAGTVGLYERHLFLCHKSHKSWPSHIEKSESDPLPKLLASALKARQDDIDLKTRLTICEGGDDVKFSDGDLLVFPEMTVFRGLVESDVDSFVEDVIVNGKPWLSGVQQELTGSYVFVCAHNSRDRRCGVCGPVLIEKFKAEIESSDLKNQVFVTACSHIGGHKYAGNVIIFSEDRDAKITGNWYGYVTPDDVHELLDKQIRQGEVIDRIWRGHMGETVKEPETLEEQLKPSDGTNVNDNEKQNQETVIEEKPESNGGCCQGANGLSCCRDENVEKEKELGGLSCWIRKWEQRPVLTTVAVVGAVATVAVAYGVYRRAR